MDLAVALLLRAIFFLVAMGFACLASVWGLLKGLKPGVTVLAGSLGAFLFLGALFAVAQSGQPVGFHELVKQGVDEVDKTPVPPPFAGTPEAEESYKSFCKSYVVMAFPAWTALVCLVAGLLAYYFSASILFRITPRVARPLAFRDWVLPEPLVFGLILGGLLKLAVVWAQGGEAAEISGNNLLVFFVGLYTLGGLSIVSFFFEKWRLPKILRLLSYVVLFQVLFEAIFALGVLDVWRDFRKTKTLPPETNP